MCLDSFLTIVENGFKRLEGLVTQITKIEEGHILEIIDDIKRTLLLDEHLIFSKKWVIETNKYFSNLKKQRISYNQNEIY